MSNIDRILAGDKEALVKEIANIATWARNLSGQEWHNITHDSNGGLNGVIGRIVDKQVTETVDPVQIYIPDYNRGNNDMSFGQAIEAAKLGKKIARAGWNGKDQYVELGTDFQYDTIGGNGSVVYHEGIGSKALVFVGTRGRQVGWLASQADMLADDWYVVE